MTQARLVRRKNRSVVLEIMEGDIPKRFVVPPECFFELKDNFGSISSDDLDLGIEYGIPFSDLLRSKVITSEMLSDSLHKEGIWTSDDVYNNPKAVQSAILSASHDILAELMQIAKSFSRKEF